MPIPSSQISESDKEKAKPGFFKPWVGLITLLMSSYFLGVLCIGCLFSFALLAVTGMLAVSPPVIGALLTTAVVSGAGFVALTTVVLGLFAFKAHRSINKDTDDKVTANSAAEPSSGRPAETVEDNKNEYISKNQGKTSKRQEKTADTATNNEEKTATRINDTRQTTMLPPSNDSHITEREHNNMPATESKGTLLGVSGFFSKAAEALRAANDICDEIYGNEGADKSEGFENRAPETSM